jgi:hypothetical protein
LTLPGSVVDNVGMVETKQRIGKKLSTPGTVFKKLISQNIAEERVVQIMMALGFDYSVFAVLIATISIFYELPAKIDASVSQ